MNKYIFIGGTGRSGSNILKAILSQQPEAASLPFEPRYILDPDGIIDFYNSLDSWSPYTIDFKLRRLFGLLTSVGARGDLDLAAIEKYQPRQINPLDLTPPRYYQWELDKHIPGFLNRVEELKSELVDFEFNNYWIGSESNKEKNISAFSKLFDKDVVGGKLSEFVLSNCDALLANKKRSVLIDDSTFSPLHIIDLKRLLPSMKLIHIYRDPRDVIASLINQRWAPSDLDQVLLWYSAVMHRWNTVKQSVDKSCYVEIKFEDLVSDFDQTLSKISDGTDVDFNGLANILDPDKTNIGRWSSTFNKAEINKINSALQSFLQQFGYL